MSTEHGSRLNLTKFLPVEAFLKHRRIVLAVFIALALVSLLLMPLVKINYDMREYLPADSQTKQSLDLLEKTFGIEGSAYVMVPVDDMAQALMYKKIISGVDGVSQVLFYDDLTDAAQPASWSDNSQMDLFLKDGQALYTVTFTNDDYSTETSQALDMIRSDLEAALAKARPEQTANGEAGIALAGSAVRTANMSSSVGGEMFWIMAVVIPLFLIILLIFTHSFAEAIMFLVVIGIAVVINIGTNIIFRHISFMTHLSVAVLQLAISMDYSIFLLHRFGEERQQEPDLKVAMVRAVRGAFAPILASALTTIAGFLALVGMRYSLGRDMGLVLSKGILLSLISVLLLLPVMTITFIKAIDKTTHRNLLPSMKGLGKGAVKLRFLLIPIWIFLAVFSFWAQSNNSFIYGEAAIMASGGSQVEKDQQLIDETFGRQNPLLIIMPQGSQAKEYQLAEKLKEIPEINSIQALASLADPALPRQLLPDAALSQFEKNGYSRMILSLDSEEEGEQPFALVDKIRVLAQTTIPEAIVFGPTSSVEDIKDVVEHDYSLVNLLSILAVGLILLITFRSLLLPVLLVLVIESAIWLNMSVPYFTGKPLSFIGFMIISAVQLGATIDYAILLTSRYIERRQFEDKIKSGRQAIELAGGSVLMSAGILAAAGISVWIVSRIEGIRELGLLIGRGAILSGIMVLIVLPQLLVLLDRGIAATDLDKHIIRRIKQMRRHK
ncbi:MAG: MMPL family transporter [Clostridiaceae bacterium]|nr:MMPL family transporter [Clostridiaceae bacterium]